MTLTIYANIFAHYQSAIDAFLAAAVSRTIAAMLPVVTSCLGIYFILYSWAGIRGKVQDWGNDMVFRVIRITLILSIGFSVAGYGQYVLNPVMNLPTDLASVVTGQTADAVAGPSILDRQLAQAWALGHDAVSKGSLLTSNGFSFYLSGLIYYASGFIMTAYAAYLILLSKGMLTVLLALGPIFIGCLIFDVTKRFFDAWLGLLVNYVFVNVIAVTVLSFTFVAFQQYLDAMTPDSGLGSALGLLLIAIIDVLLIMGVTHVASSLAGGAPIGNGFGNWVVSSATGGASRILASKLGQGSKWLGGKAMGGAQSAAQSAARAAARAATSRFRMNSIKGL
ncbi:type IV secretion system protein [Burkholderia cenocepacia]|uniref:type IV secretion system protein n=1 Tax=Burkholderia cenocepacia TaxID=95486 RepID=UPI002238DA5B|nr:type IV secretion system protein [Burkholderia cenocepacia]MCW5119988.1 type IV secretion system protein [Burkholderia cenocepacia]MCW5132521.1 type IV secretion system protein [Burkholderia cenocepacia]MCW5175183.1 type IV secretion system protein [Burkholderia cenocepacia]